MSDPVIGQLGRHLADIERQEARERKLDEWLDKATSNDLHELLEDRVHWQRFYIRLLVMLDEGFIDPNYGIEQMRGLLIEFLEEQASEG